MIITIIVVLFMLVYMCVDTCLAEYSKLNDVKIPATVIKFTQFIKGIFHNVIGS